MFDLDSGQAEMASKKYLTKKMAWQDLWVWFIYEDLRSQELIHVPEKTTTVFVVIKFVLKFNYLIIKVEKH